MNHRITCGYTMSDQCRPGSLAGGVTFRHNRHLHSDTCAYPQNVSSATRCHIAFSRWYGSVTVWVTRLLSASDRLFYCADTKIHGKEVFEDADDLSKRRCISERIYHPSGRHHVGRSFPLLCSRYRNRSYGRHPCFFRLSLIARFLRCACAPARAGLFLQGDG